MKRVIGLSVIAVVAVLMTSAPAGATTLPVGAALVAGIGDRSSLFDVTDENGGSQTGVPIAFGVTPVVGDESRSIASVRSIEFGAVGSSLGVPTINGLGTYIPGYSPGNLTAMVYDVNLGAGSVIGAATDEKNLYFIPGVRYTNGGGTDGTWTDMYAESVTATTGTGYGGLLVIYNDPTNNYSLGTSVGSWVEGNGPGTTDTSLTASDTFPGISDVEPWLVAVLAPMPASYQSAYGLPSDTVLYEHLPENFVLGSANTASGLAFANVIGGTAAGQILQDFFGTGLDLRIEFAPKTDGAAQLGGWQVESDDPIQFCTVVPEPTTLSLLGMGLLGLVGAWKRRK